MNDCKSETHYPSTIKCIDTRNQFLKILVDIRTALLRSPRCEILRQALIKRSRLNLEQHAAGLQRNDGMPCAGGYLDTDGQALAISVYTKPDNLDHHPLLIERDQCHQTTNRNQQFISRVGSVPMGVDVAARLNGVEQALTGVRVAFVDIPVLSLAWTALCLRGQLFQVICIKNLYDRAVSVAESAATICLTVFSTENSRSNKAVQRADKAESVSI